VRRRAVIAGICGVLVSPFGGYAQPLPGKLVRIGVLGNEWWPPVEGLPEGCAVSVSRMASTSKRVPLDARTERTERSARSRIGCNTGGCNRHLGHAGRAGRKARHREDTDREYRRRSRYRGACLKLRPPRRERNWVFDRRPRLGCKASRNSQRAATRALSCCCAHKPYEPCPRYNASGGGARLRGDPR
jgi:hypothetical protein